MRRMKLSVGLLLGAMLIGIGGGVAINHLIGAQDELAITSLESAYPTAKVLRLGFEVENPTNRSIEAPEFWAYLPVMRTAHQYVNSVEANVPMRLISDASGNQRAVFVLERLPPYGKKYVQVTVHLGMSDAPVATGTDADPQAYLGPQPFMESDAPAIKQLATELDVKTDVSPAVEWVHRAIRNPGYVANDRGALYALRTRVGDCSDHMNLLGALLRAGGIPARGVAGFVQPESGVVRAAQLHNWIEYYDGAGWVGLDADRGLRTLPGTQYVAMRIIDHQDDDSAPDAQSAFGAPSGLIVRMD